MFIDLKKDFKQQISALEAIESLILKYKRRREIINKKKYGRLMFLKKSNSIYKILCFNDELYLYLLRNNLYRILDKGIKDTIIRKLINLEILLASKGTISDLIIHFNNLIKSYRNSPVIYRKFYFHYRIRKVIFKMKTHIIDKAIGLDHPSVKRVLEIAEEILSKNKVLNAERLYNVIKKRLKIPRNGILFIIQFLLSKKILIEGSKFSKKTVLENFVRKKIFNYIRINPGVHFSNLRKEALSSNIKSSGQLVWHLEMLLKFNYIKKIKVGNYTVFLPFDMDEDIARNIFLLRDRINNKLLHLLVENNTIVKSEIYKKIDEKREDVYYRIKNLMGYEIVILSEDSDKEVCINPKKKEIITKILKKSKNIDKNKLLNKEEVY